jgi:hypothetical protein
LNFSRLQQTTAGKQQPAEQRQLHVRSTAEALRRKQVQLLR